ncbi:proline hydroxylase [Saccharibacter sp. 17.LH.SD]|uniref:2OG-Fe(II) oxygenase n=1 Tax=Saccharibacter sp. 17.LH.SD TaxID=2689393 RepID=UPI00136D65F7|nr:2OG-Fe(II) oxygenase [Saccharibacter sp. 17.LH.SD]MXV44426.1 proline hydroxylase [Saccharibacter sp. 17.LH.SD]
MTDNTLSSHIDAYDWPAFSDDINREGWVILPNLFMPHECQALIDLYGPTDTFRSHVRMAHHGFGRGEYRYFSYPLPPLVETARRALYAHLAPIANSWNDRMGIKAHFPRDHAAFLDRCHEAGQPKPTPLLLKYKQGDYNCLHQDLYGEHVFPLQVAALLSEPGEDFTGGEFILTEQRPRMQSRASVVSLKKGDGVLFAVNDRPHRGPRGDYRVKMRHGVSTIRSGSRHTVGLIFHDAA